jgi:hypothetical protein
MHLAVGFAVAARRRQERPTSDTWCASKLSYYERCTRLLADLEQHRYLNMDDLREHKKEAS